MIHQPLGGAQGQAADIEIQANEILHHKLVRKLQPLPDIIARLWPSSCPLTCSTRAAIHALNAALQTLNGYIAEFSGQPIEKVTADTDRDFFMSAQEAVEYGVSFLRADGSIMHPTLYHRATFFT